MAAGVSHYTKRKEFIGIMRGMPFKSLHPLAVYWSGVCEASLGFMLLVAPFAQLDLLSKVLFLGVGQMIPIQQKKAADLLFWLVVLMTPANINMALGDVPFGKTRLKYGFKLFEKGRMTHFARGLAQVVLLIWLTILGRMSE